MNNKENILYAFLNEYRVKRILSFKTFPNIRIMFISTDQLITIK